MTLIVGLVDADGTVLMGADSAATNNLGNQVLVDSPKIFYPIHCPWFLVGFAGSFRLGNLLRYSLKAPRPSAKANLHEFMTTRFVDALRKCLGKGGAAGHDDEGVETGGALLVGHRGRLFKISDDYSVISLQQNYIALGSAEFTAYGALFATEGKPSAERLAVALAAGASMDAWCRPPFEFLELSPNRKAK